jgi:hypothetical protein
MELVVIFGPPAVGKMAVGLELEKLTGYRLFHNHMVIELVHNFFEFETDPFRRLVEEFRARIFEEAKAGGLPGLIFTYVWALDQESDRLELEGYCAKCGMSLADAYLVELEASQATRLERNKGELRLSQKPTKRNLKRSELNLVESDRLYRLNSTEEFPFQPGGRYLKINNEGLSPEQTAALIQATWKLGAGPSRVIR